MKNHKAQVDHYSVEGEPGTWTKHSGLAEAVERARSLGVQEVWGVRYKVHASGQSGVDKRVVWKAAEST